MARTTRKTGGARNGYLLPGDKIKQRDLAFAAYRDFGPRSMHRLCELLKCDGPDIADAAGCGTLVGACMTGKNA